MLLVVCVMVKIYANALTKKTKFRDTNDGQGQNVKSGTFADAVKYIAKEYKSADNDKSCLDFTDILDDMQKGTSFEELQTKCKFLEDVVGDARPTDLYPMISQGDLATHYHQALSLIPNDMPKGQALIPMKVLADGNCLSRAGSVLAFGDEVHHTQMRARICMELAIHRRVPEQGA